jgi:hypothetical protein
VVFLRSVLRLLVTATVVPSSLILVTLMKEALSYSETSVLTRATWRNIPEDIILQERTCYGPEECRLLGGIYRLNYQGDKNLCARNNVSSEEWCLLGCYAVWLL